MPRCCVASNPPRKCAGASHSDLCSRRESGILKKFSPAEYVLLASGVFILFLWHRCVTLARSAEGFIAIPFRQYLCNSSYFSEKSISCAITAAKPVDFFPTWALCESCLHQDTNYCVSFPGWRFLIYAFAVGVRLNLWAIKLLGGAWKNGCNWNFKARHLLLSRRREKLQAFFNSCLSFVQGKMPQSRRCV